MSNQDSFYLRDTEVGKLTKLSKSTRWRLERNGEFPRRRRLSGRAVGWLSTEIKDWLTSREIINGNNVTCQTKQ